MAVQAYGRRQSNAWTVGTELELIGNWISGACDCFEVNMPRERRAADRYTSADP